ncbi:MAG: glycosyltransferase family 4 protein [Tepidisphaerales bacterium]
MTAPRLLLLVTDLHRGGTPTVVRELARHLARHPVHVEVACLAGWGDTADDIAALGLSVHALGAASVRDLNVIASLDTLLRDGRFSHLLSFLVHANAVAAWLARRHGDLRCFQSVQTTQPRPRWHWWVQRWAARFAERVIVPSRSVADFAAARCGLDPAQLAVIPNGVDLALFDLPPRPAPLPDATVRLGFIGRLDPVKRVADLLEALPLLPPHYRLDLYGDGPERSRLQRLVRRLELQTRVTFHGMIPRPHEALANLDLLVLPSEAEGFGLVLAEAMAAGVPVVATAAPGIVDVVTDGVTGLLAPVARPDTLADTLQRALIEPGRTQRLQAARLHARKHFDWTEIARQYLDTLGLGAPR